MRRSATSCWCFLLLSFAAIARAADGNRLVYLDEPCDPYWVGLAAPRLITPQWVGEEGVELVVVLSIDDMKDGASHERFLRPIIERLKQIDARAPVSVMTTHVDPADPQLQTWLREGLSLETHTYDHPCPCLQGGDAAKAKSTFDRSVEALMRIPGNRPVAFRMPCCDSINSASPRFFAEMFNKTTPEGRFLGMDSSVFVLFTSNDAALPRDLVQGPGGGERMARYVPKEREYVNYVENYPYPYVIGRLCWEVPPVMPGDWQGFNLNRAHSPATVADMKAALDAAACKQGVYTLCFHPGAWIRNGQVIELIDYAAGKYGKRVKFLTFRDIFERLTKNLLGGQPLRAANGQDNGVRLLDLNGDGLMDVVIGNEHVRQTRLWSSATKSWTVSDFPIEVTTAGPQGDRRDAGVRFGVLQATGAASVLVRNEKAAGLWHFDGRGWVADPQGLAGLELGGPIATAVAGRDQGVRLRDLNGDGICELIVGSPQKQGAFRWNGREEKGESLSRGNRAVRDALETRCAPSPPLPSPFTLHPSFLCDQPSPPAALPRGEGSRGWTRLPFRLPPETAIVDAEGRDAGLRFVDIDEDTFPDVVFSNAERYALYLFHSMEDGWSRKVHAANRGDASVIPMIVRGDGTNNGAWFKYGHMIVQNEDTGKILPQHVDSRSYGQLIADPGARR